MIYMPLYNFFFHDDFCCEFIQPKQFNTKGQRKAMKRHITANITLRQ